MGECEEDIMWIGSPQKTPTTPVSMEHTMHCQYAALVPSSKYIPAVETIKSPWK